MKFSENLQRISNGGSVLIYDSKLGTSLILHGDSVELLSMLEAGRTPSDIQQEYDVEGLDELLEVLQAKYLYYDPEIPFDYSQVRLAHCPPEALEAGAMAMHLRLNITEMCNLNCDYCFERISNVYAKKRNMPWNVAKTAIDNFLALNKENGNKALSIRFFGGEPLLNWPLVCKCLEYSQTAADVDVSIEYIINTNGTLLTDEIAKTLADYHVSISLSVDGDQERHDTYRCYPSGCGSFEEIDKRLRHLTKNGCTFNMSVVCSDANFEHLRDLIDYVARRQSELEYNIPICFNNIQITGKDRKEIYTVQEKAAFLLDALEYAREKGVYAFGGLTHFVFQKFINNMVGKYCGGTGSELSIDPDGGVFPCSGLDIKLGTIYDLKSIFKSDAYKRIATREAGQIAQCVGCDIEGFCAGGCLADVIAASGSESGDYDGCELQRHQFKELAKVYLLRDPADAPAIE